MFFFFLILLFSFYITAYAKPIISNEDAPTKINADDMDYNSDKNIITFSGDVYVERDGFFMWADTLYVYLTPKAGNSTKNNAGQASDVEKIIAENNVRMKYKTNTGSSGKAIYETKKGLFTMLQNPILKDGDNSITGEEIRYYVNENRSEVIGGKKRVEAFFTTKAQ